MELLLVDIHSTYFSKNTIQTSEEGELNVVHLVPTVNAIIILQTSRIFLLLAVISSQELQVHHLETLQVVHNRSNSTDHLDSSDRGNHLYTTSKCNDIVQRTHAHLKFL